MKQTHKALRIPGWLLMLALLSCDLPFPSEPTPTVFIPPANTPTETEATTSEPVDATDPPTSAPDICHPPGSPTLTQPANPENIPATIEAYLSAGGDVPTLESTLIDWDALQTVPTPHLAAADLTGDGHAEIAMALRSPADLLIYGCQAGGYTQRYSAQSAIADWIPGWLPELIQTSDVNEDGVWDVAYTLSTCGAHTCNKTLEIVAWNGSGFTSLMGDTLEMPYPTFTILSGRIEAQAGAIGSVGAEPQRTPTEIWEWDGSAFVHTQTVWPPPIYRYHALLDGEWAMDDGDYPTASAAFERVIADDTLQEWAAMIGGNPADERAILEAFAHWRLLLIHLLSDPAAAQTEYDLLQADYPSGTAGHDVAAMAAVFWDAYDDTESIALGCQDVSTIADTGDLLSFFNTTYGYANPLWEVDDLCPF